MAYIYNSDGQILATTAATILLPTVGVAEQLGFYDINTTDGLLPVTIGFERLAPAQLVSNICPRTVYLLRVAFPANTAAIVTAAFEAANAVSAANTAVTAANAAVTAANTPISNLVCRTSTGIVTAVTTAGAERLAAVSKRVNFSLPINGVGNNINNVNNSGFVTNINNGFVGSTGGSAGDSTAGNDANAAAAVAASIAALTQGYYYLGSGLTLTTNRQLASPFTVTVTLAGRIVFDSPFRGKLAGQAGIFTLQQDATNYASVGYTTPLPLTLSSCQSCGCPPQFDCSASGACVYNPNRCNGVCNGRCYGRCPKGSFCNLASNGLYSCVSDIGNSWFWLWLFFLIFLIILIIVLAIIGTSISRKGKAVAAAKASALTNIDNCGCIDSDLSSAGSAI